MVLQQTLPPQLVRTGSQGIFEHVDCGSELLPKDCS